MLGCVVNIRCEPSPEMWRSAATTATLTSDYDRTSEGEIIINEAGEEIRLTFSQPPQIAGPPAPASRDTDHTSEGEIIVNEEHKEIGLKY